MFSKLITLRPVSKPFRAALGGLCKKLELEVSRENILKPTMEYIDMVTYFRAKTDFEYTFLLPYEAKVENFSFDSDGFGLLQKLEFACTDFNHCPILMTVDKTSADALKDQRVKMKECLLISKALDKRIFFIHEESLTDESTLSKVSRHISNDFK